MRLGGTGPPSALLAFTQEGFPFTCSYIRLHVHPRMISLIAVTRFTTAEIRTPQSLPSPWSPSTGQNLLHTGAFSSVRRRIDPSYNPWDKIFYREPTRKGSHYSTYTLRNGDPRYLAHSREARRRRRSSRATQARRIPECPYSHPLRSTPAHQCGDEPSQAGPATERGRVSLSAPEPKAVACHALADDSHVGDSGRLRADMPSSVTSTRPPIISTFSRASRQRKT